VWRGRSARLARAARGGTSAILARGDVRPARVGWRPARVGRRPARVGGRQRSLTSLRRAGPRRTAADDAQQRGRI